MTARPVDPHLTLLDEARQAAAVADRAQRRLLTEADDADATFIGSLETVGESGAVVVLETIVDRRLRGRVRAVSAKHVQIVGDHGDAHVRTDAITVLRAGPRVPVRAGGGERLPRGEASLAVTLAPAVEHRAEVDVLLDGGSTVRGTAVAVGQDVLTIRNPATSDRCLVALDRAAVVVVHPY